MYPPYAEKQPILYEKSHCESLFYEGMQWLFLFLYQANVTLKALFKASVTCRQQLTVAQCIIDTCHVNPEFVVSYTLKRISRLSSTIRMSPSIPHNLVLRMRSIHQYVVFFVGLSSLNLCNFFTDMYLSLSVGSIISVPCTGKERVGAW